MYADHPASRHQRHG